MGQADIFVLFSLHTRRYFRHDCEFGEKTLNCWFPDNDRGMSVHRSEAHSVVSGFHLRGIVLILLATHLNNEIAIQ